MPSFSSSQTYTVNMPSFSSSLLDAIYHSIDESAAGDDERQHVGGHFRRNINAAAAAAAQGEEEIQSLRRAIMVEKWMENYATTSTPRHFSSNSASSTDSTLFSSSETDSSASRSTPKLSLLLPMKAVVLSQNYSLDGGGIGKLKQPALESTAAKTREGGRFRWTKSKAMKIYSDLKKAREPISPGGKITSFLNSIFSPRSLKKSPVIEKWGTMRKSRSMKDTQTSCALESRSCLSKNPSSKTARSKRSVKFCPVSTVIVDGDCCHKNTYEDDERSTSFSLPSVGRQFAMKNVDSLRLYEETNPRQHHEFRQVHENRRRDSDELSCASSDLFELENIGRIGIETFDEELPVYGTTNMKMNEAIARGLAM